MSQQWAYVAIIKISQDFKYKNNKYKKNLKLQESVNINSKIIFQQ